MLHFLKKQTHLTSQTWLVLILILAFLLRLPLLNGSFWLDEAAQALESARPLSQQLQIIPDFQPPLIHLITHFALSVSPAEWWLRFWAAFFPGLVTIWATYQLGKKLHSPQLGLISALLLATNSFHIFYSQELRPYSLPAMFALLSWLSLISWTKKPPASSDKAAQREFILYTVWTIGGLYSSYLYPFVTLSQLTGVFFQHRLYIKKYLFSLLCSGLTFLPWLPIFLQQLATGQSWRQEMPGWENIVSFSQLKSLPLVLGKFLFGVLDLELSWPYFVIMFLLGITFSLLVFRLYQQKCFSRKKLATQSGKILQTLMIALIVPLLGSWLISFLVPVVQPKRLLFLLPQFYLLMVFLTLWADQKPANIFSRLFSVFKNKWRSKLFYVFIFLILFINLFSTAQYYTQPKYQRENWQQLVQQLKTQFPPAQTVVIFSFDEPFAPWRWYAGQTYPTLTTGQLNIDHVENLSNQLKSVTDYQYVLVFDYLRDITDPDDLLLVTLRDFGYQEVGALDQVNIGFVRIYARSDNLLSQNFRVIKYFVLSS